MLLLMAASAAFTAPQQIAGEIRDSDYPREAKRDSTGGTVSITMQVDPEGKVERCDVRLTSGGSVLERATCELVQKRFRFRPARNESGNPIHAVLTQTVSWLMGGSRERHYRYAELTLQLNKIPKKFDLDKTRRLALLTSPEGAIRDCLATWEPGETALGSAACREAKAGFKPEPVRDASGNPVEAVRIIEVHFKKQTGKRVGSR